MTYKQLQEYLDVEKWRESTARECDMCGRYVRCRYCVRTEEYPCARAHNRLMDVLASPLPEPIPDWLLPEPPVYEKFGTDRAVEEEAQGAEPACKEEPAREDAPPSSPLPPAEKGEPEAKSVALFLPAPTEEEAAPRGSRHVICVKAGERDGVRLLTLRRRSPSAQEQDGQEI